MKYCDPGYSVYVYPKSFKATTMEDLMSLVTKFCGGISANGKICVPEVKSISAFYDSRFRVYRAVVACYVTDSDWEEGTLWSELNSRVQE